MFRSDLVGVVTLSEFILSQCAVFQTKYMAAKPLDQRKIMADQNVTDLCFLLDSFQQGHDPSLG